MAVKEMLDKANVLVWYYCHKCSRCHRKGSKIFQKHIKEK